MGNTRLSYTLDPATSSLKVLEESHYYPFGLKHQGYNDNVKDLINSSSGVTVENTGFNRYQYKYNGKEFQDELGLNFYDYGARNYDPAIGRWMNVDPLAEKYHDYSPYCYVMNNPINAIDPDGRVVIFVNGLWGTPTGASGGGTVSHWGKSWVNNALNRIGDKKARFYDGSADCNYNKGGTSRVSWNFDYKNRMRAGFIKGKADAADIVGGLQRDSNGKITESIKFVTSSMGAAYSRGMSDGIMDYVNSENKKIEAYNSALSRNKDGSYVNPSLVKQRLDVNIEFTVDLDPFQGSSVGPDSNSQSNYYMRRKSSWATGHISGSTEIGNDIMEGHHPSWAPTEKLPKGKMNPSGSYIKENPSK